MPLPIGFVEILGNYQTPHIAVRGGTAVSWFSFKFSLSLHGFGSALRKFARFRRFNVVNGDPSRTSHDVASLNRNVPAPPVQHTHDNHWLTP